MSEMNRLHIDFVHDFDYKLMKLCQAVIWQPVSFIIIMNLAINSIWVNL